MELLQRIDERTATVAVIGLGYAGMPVAVAAASSGFRVVGVDVDANRVDELNAGRSPFLDMPSSKLAELVGARKFKATIDASASKDADIVLICVPTPLRQEHPDMSHIEAAAKSLAPNLHKGMLVILESTTYPGTTEDFLREILETSGLKAGEDFHLGFSPERIDPGSEKFGITNVPKIVGGIDEETTDLMEAFYSTFIERVVKVSSPRAAEMAKLLENTYRHVNIALVNEMAVLCHDLGIDVWEVIDAAATKPFGFHPFYPGPGTGGHCIPVDPSYLSWRVRQMGDTARFVELAREINDMMPGYVVTRISDCLNERGKSLKGSKVLILGVSYKPGVADTRESAALDVISRLRKAGADVSFNDPHVSEINVADTEMIGVELSDEWVSAADIVVIITDHPGYDWAHIGSTATLILDTRNAMKGISGPIVRL